MQLNINKSYELSEGSIKLDVVVPNDWLVQLSTLCSESLSFSKEQSAQLMGDFNKHVGQGSTYSLKPSLQEGLKIIFQWLTLEGKKALSASEKSAIALKIQEGIDACTPGFHDRVNDMLGSFYNPQSLEQHLTIIRNSIVDTAARQNTDEVHAHNRFFIVAAIAGYGVKTINWDDSYRGELSDETINNKLELAFKEQYIPVRILKGLKDSIKSVLHNQFDYKGLKGTEDGSYTVGEYDKWLAYLHQLFGGPELMAADYLIMNEDMNAIIDLNWKNINKRLFETMFSKQFIVSSNEEFQQFLNLFNECSPNELNVNVNQLLKKVNITTVSDLTTFLAFFDVNVALKKQIIFTFINQFAIEEQFQKLMAILVRLELPTNSAELIKSSLIDDSNFIYTIFSCNRTNPLIDAINKHNNLNTIKIILDLISTLTPEVQKEILIENDNNADNALLLAVRHQPAAVAPLLEVIKTLTQEIQKEILMNNDGYGINLLLLAARRQPEAFTSLLDVIKKLTPETQKEILMKKDRYHNNPLLRALMNEAKAVDPLLDFIKTLTPEVQKEILIVNDKDGDNALLLALMIQAKAVEPLLEVIKTLTPEVQKEILMKSNKDGYNALTLAMTCRHQAVAPLIDVIKTLTPEAQKEILIKNNFCGENALTLALRDQLQAVPLLLELISKLPQQVQIEFKHTTFYGNALAIAHSQQSQTELLIFAAIMDSSPKELISILPSGYSSSIIYAADKYHEALSTILEKINTNSHKVNLALAKANNLHYTPKGFEMMGKSKKIDFILIQLTLHLAVLQEKANSLKSHHSTASVTAQTLYEKLEKELTIFKKSEKKPHNLLRLEQSWVSSINEARPELSKHRGIISYIPKVLACLAILVGSVFSLANYGYEQLYRKNKSYGFFSPAKTKSEKLLDEIEHAAKKLGDGPLGA